VTNKVEWSDETYRIYGFSPGEFSPTIETTVALVHPEDLAFVEARLKAVIRGELEYNIDHRVIRPDGRIIYIHAIGEITRDEAGNPVQMLGIVVDITERMQVDFALKESEARLRQVIDLVPHFIFAKNRAGQFILANNAVADAYGTTVEELLGKTDADFNPNSSEVAHFTEDDQEVIASGMMKDISEEMITDSTGGTRYLHTIKIPYHITTTSETAILGVSTNITEQKLVENELRWTAGQLRDLSNRLQAIREEESTRIAREIHDELGQTLTALKIDLAFLEDSFLSPGINTLEEIRIRTGGMSSLVDSAIQTVRRISSELRPAALDRFGLVAAIEWQGDEFRKRTGIRCVYNVPKEEWEIDPETSTAIFRILQESLTNITRHADATEVRVSLRRKSASLVLQVDDNGRGIRLSDQKKSGSFGLLGIRERASALGGSVTISSAPDKGTSIIVSIPDIDLRQETGVL
jgi:PAS domain S-box-containing protein